MGDGLVVRPGDTLALCVPQGCTAKQAEEMKRRAAAEFPGVTTVVLSGVAGGPFVYRGTRPPVAEA